MKYDLILCDPPWSYNDKSSRGSAEKHYKTMSIKDIMELPVSELAADNSVLFLWATFPLLPEALKVMDAWDFKYKTVAFTWIKTNKNKAIAEDISESDTFFGIGHYTASNAEICLLGKRGKGLERLNRDVRQVIISEREKHSHKPLETFKRIDRLYGADINRIELFATERQPGWTAYGWDLDHEDIRVMLNNEIIGDLLS
jgi:N6-adenosine-specific RNA methylase IME4